MSPHGDIIKRATSKSDPSKSDPLYRASITAAYAADYWLSARCWEEGALSLNTL